MDKLAVTVKEAAELASVDVRTIYEWCRRGMPYTTTRGGGKWVIRVSDLDEWMANEARANAGIV